MAKKSSNTLQNVFIFIDEGYMNSSKVFRIVILWKTPMQFLPRYVKVYFNIIFLNVEFFHDGGRYHIEASPLSCSARLVSV